MKRQTQIRCAVIAGILASMDLANAQAAGNSQQKVRVVPRNVQTVPRLRPTPGPEDRVSLDLEGNIVAEGARGPDGRPHTFRIERRVHVSPRVEASAQADGMSIDYTYRVTNGPAGKQWIQVFWVDTYGAVERTSAPDFWMSSHRNVDPQLTRVYFGRNAKDHDERGRLTTGTTASGFHLRSNWLPGVVIFRAIGFKAAGANSDETMETFPGAMSDWLREEIARQMSQENNSVAVYTIGPKINPAIPILHAVRAEFLEAIRLPEFSADTGTLAKLATSEDLAAIRQSIRTLAGTAKGLPAEFYAAMLSNLK